MPKLTKAMQERFLSVACALSPENISWDGERPAREIAKARTKLLAEWRGLETEVGRSVTEDEVWGTVFPRRTLRFNRMTERAGA